MRSYVLRQQAPRAGSRPDRPATLEHIEEQIGLTVTLEDGPRTLAGFLAAARLSDARLSFANVEIDRSFLRDALEQLDAIVTAFPLRGNLNDNPPHLAAPR